jgi:transcriptional regulator with PAS, ATPase and Fis domain
MSGAEAAGWSLARSGSEGSDRDPFDLALASLVSSVARGFQEGDPRAARASLEQSLSALPGVQLVRIAPAAPYPSVREASPLRLSLPLPGLDSGQRLEVSLSAEASDGSRVRRFFERVAIVIAPLVRAERLVDPLFAEGARDARSLTGSSAVMRALRAQLAKIARTDFSVLIEGESGVGKELVARQIHEHSRRRRGPFVTVNCAAIVETLLEAELFGIEDRTATGVRGRKGRFEQADGGTLFLDEIADLSPAAQAKLLRVLQERSLERVGGHATHRVDARILAATNRRLSGLVDEGRFRLDLYYRLNCLEVQVPPLRARREDIAELVELSLRRHRHVRSLSVSPAAMDVLLNYRWPGNVRELERTVERAVALSDGETIEVTDLPGHMIGQYIDILMPSADADDTMRAWGSRYARLVLGRCGNNKREACRTLGISYHTLQAYLRYQPRRRAARTAVSDAASAHDATPRPLLDRPGEA